MKIHRSSLLVASLLALGGIVGYFLGAAHPPAARADEATKPRAGGKAHLPAAETRRRRNRRRYGLR